MTASVIRAPPSSNMVWPRAALVASSIAPPSTMIPVGGPMPAGGSGKRFSNGAIRSALKGSIAAAMSTRIAASASARPKRACREPESTTPMSAPNNRRLIGEASIQKIFEAMKNIGAAPPKSLWQGPRLVATRAVAYFGPRTREERDEACTRCCRSDWPHAPHPPSRRLRGHGMHDSRQGGVHESGRLGQGPRGPRDHQGRGREGRVAAWRRDRRRHRRQYGHRHRHGGERARL